MTDKTEKAIQLKKVTVKDDFWSYFQNLVRDVVIPYQEKILNDAIPGIEKSHAIENFRIAAEKRRASFTARFFRTVILQSGWKGQLMHPFWIPAEKLKKVWKKYNAW